jgi:hypothetical protein
MSRRTELGGSRARCYGLLAALRDDTPAVPDDRDVPEVKRGDLGQPKALGHGRHGGIDDAKRKIKD